MGSTTIIGSNANDHYDGSESFWDNYDYVKILAQGGDDKIWASGEADLWIEGGYGNDQILLYSENDDGAKAWGEAGNDEIKGGEGDDLLYGGSGDDILESYSGDDVLRGEDGNDHITVWSADIAYGGAGNDFYVVYDDGVIDPMGAVYEYANQGIDTVKTFSEGYTLGDNIENLIVGKGWQGARFNGNSLNNVITGSDQGWELIYAGAGNDTVNGGAGDDYIHGEDGDDVLNGGADDDALSGGAGNDRLYGGAGGDQMDGGAGNDLLDGGAGYAIDTMYGRAGNDIYVVDTALDVVIEYANEGTDTVRSSMADYTMGANIENLQLIGLLHANATGNAQANVIDGNTYNNFIQGMDGADTLNGGAGADILRGGNHNDRVYGGDDNDTLYGEVGNDILGGGAGVDWLFGGEGKDELAGNDGDDLLYGEGGDDTFYAGLGNDVAQGGNGDDLMYGEGGNDTLNGGGMTDRLFGNDGHDRLFGGAGGDRLSGGSGVDAFVYTAFSDSFIGSGIDQILDFVHGDDFIDLSSLDANANIAGNQAFVWMGMSDPVNAAGTLWGQVIAADAYNPQRVRIHGDTNGDGTSEFQIDVIGVASLTALDFGL